MTALANQLISICSPLIYSCVCDGGFFGRFLSFLLELMSLGLSYCEMDEHIAGFVLFLTFVEHRYTITSGLSFK